MRRTIYDREEFVFHLSAGDRCVFVAIAFSVLFAAFELADIRKELETLNKSTAGEVCREAERGE